MANSLVQPDGWWNAVPKTIDQFDVDLSAQIKTFFDLSEANLNDIRFLTENGWISFGTVLLFALWLNYLKKSIQLPKILLSNLFLTLLGLGFLDFLTSQLMKPSAGRLKPLHLFYDPQSPMYLSFPSTHASASGFLTFFWILQTLGCPYSGKLPRFIFCTSVALVFGFSAFSRIIVGQHYFLDVVTGYTIGSIVGFTAHCLVKRFKSLT